MNKKPRMISTPYSKIVLGLILLLAAGPVFALQTPAVSFTDVSANSGLNVPHYSAPEKRYIVESVAGGIALFDCNEDGYLDVAYVNSSSVERFKKGGDRFVSLYQQMPSTQTGKASLKFENISAKAGLTKKGWGMGLTVVDYDNDGFVDLFATGYSGNALFRGVGKCKFVDVTEASGLKSSDFSTGAAWADYDRDGDIDLFVAGYVLVDLNNLPDFGSSKTCTFREIRVQCGPLGLPGERDFLFRNKGDGTFEDVSKEAGVRDDDKYFGLGVIWGDYNNDGWPDFFVANDSTPNYLYRNNKDGTFSEVGFEMGVSYNASGREQGSMGVTWGDFNQDGLLDLFVTDFESEPNALYKNLGSDKGFADITLVTKIGQPSRPFVGWGTAFEDFDNDGLPDLFIVNGHVYPQVEMAAQTKQNLGYRQHLLFFRNLGNGKFDDITQEAGLNKLTLYSRRGGAFGDLNNDGLVDVVATNLGSTPTVLLNTTQTNNQSVIIELAQESGNRQAVGARVTIKTSKRLLVREVQAGSSYLSQNDLRLHFGLGSKEVIETVSVRWSDGKTEDILGVTPNKVVKITQGKGVTSSKNFSSFPLALSKP
jgi:hypothetical protein